MPACGRSHRARVGLEMQASCGLASGLGVDERKYTVIIIETARNESMSISTLVIMATPDCSVCKIGTVEMASPVGEPQTQGAARNKVIGGTSIRGTVIFSSERKARESQAPVEKLDDGTGPSLALLNTPSPTLLKPCALNCAPASRSRSLARCTYSVRPLSISRTLNSWPGLSNPVRIRNPRPPHPQHDSRAKRTHHPLLLQLSPAVLDLSLAHPALFSAHMRLGTN